MEAEGHTLRELHAGDGWRREVVGVEHLEVAAIRRVVVDETHQPAVVLTRPAGRGDEHELAGCTPGPDVVDFRSAGVEVVLEVRGGVERVGREVGFSSPANFREQFRRLTGVAPQSYRNTFLERIAG